LVGDVFGSLRVFLFIFFSLGALLDLGLWVRELFGNVTNAPFHFFFFRGTLHPYELDVLREVERGKRTKKKRGKRTKKMKGKETKKMKAERMKKMEGEGWKRWRERDEKDEGEDEKDEGEDEKNEGGDEKDEGGRDERKDDFFAVRKKKRFR
jgi:hypothetical protein